jgi:hypothetical protein
MRESSASKPARASTHIRRPEPHIAVGYPVCGTPEMPTMSASSDTCGNDDLHRVVCPTRMPTVELDAHSSSAFADGSSRMIRQTRSCSGTCGCLTSGLTDGRRRRNRSRRAEPQWSVMGDPFEPTHETEFDLSRHRCSRVLLLGWSVAEFGFGKLSEQLQVVRRCWNHQLPLGEPR